MEATTVAQTWIRTREWREFGEFGCENYIESLGGVDWNEAPLPYPWHRCAAQTRGWIGLSYTERCACGAIRMRNSGPWLERNQTRHHRQRDKRIKQAARVQVTCRTCGKEYETSALAPDANGQCTSCWSDMFLRTGRP